MEIYKENTPTIMTERLVLRKFAIPDLADMFDLYSDAEVNTFLPWFPLTTLTAALEYLTHKILPEYSKEIAYSYAIALKENDKLIGYVHINDIGGANDIGYAIAKQFWHKGMASEACAAVIQHLKDVRFPYLTATHDVNNPHSGGVMQKVGMQYKYSYIEQVQPKNIAVTFRLYQLNIDGEETRTYDEYWNKYPTHFIESDVL